MGATAAAGTQGCVQQEIFDVPTQADDRMPGVRLLRQLADS
ncbi:hypothetical protein [Pseudofrankia saprophytica]|nr:hypothetical protein [Pseudofrankia saprophytica]